VRNPEEADLILVAGILEHNVFEDLRSKRIWRQYPEKCFGYSELDNVPSFLHGVYASATRSKGMFNRMQSCGYPGHNAWRPNPCPLPTPFYRLPKLYLFTFMGRNSHPVRKKLFQVPWPFKDVLVEDTSRKYQRFEEANQNCQIMRERYWKVMAQSKFVLCPRGAGASSIRLFEAMQAGVAPVIVSDAWLPAWGPDWNEFSVFIPERQAGKTYEILKYHESEYVERGKLAAAAYGRWFSDEAAWGQLLAAIQAIRHSQIIPERWFVRSHKFIYLLELMFHWRYQLPMRIKGLPTMLSKITKLRS
jgi:hypothetical protein